MKRTQMEVPNIMTGGLGERFTDTDTDHFCLVTDDPKDMGRASKIGQFQSSGYEIIEQVAEGQAWMRCSQELNQRNLKEAEDAAAKKWVRTEPQSERDPNDPTVEIISHTRTRQRQGESSSIMATSAPSPAG